MWNDNFCQAILPDKFTCWQCQVGLQTKVCRAFHKWIHGVCILDHLRIRWGPTRFGEPNKFGNNNSESHCVTIVRWNLFNKWAGTAQISSDINWNRHTHTLFGDSSTTSCDRGHQSTRLSMRLSRTTLSISFDYFFCAHSPWQLFHIGRLIRLQKVMQKEFLTEQRIGEAINQYSSIISKFYIGISLNIHINLSKQILHQNTIRQAKVFLKSILKQYLRSSKRLSHQNWMNKYSICSLSSTSVCWKRTSTKMTRARFPSDLTPPSSPTLTFQRYVLA